MRASRPASYQNLSSDSLVVGALSRDGTPASYSNSGVGVNIYDCFCGSHTRHDYTAGSRPDDGEGGIYRREQKRVGR
jgi:hypothetical protein